jgi:hypothetical protein
MVEKPRNPKLLEKPINIAEKAFHQQAMKELISVISHEWLEE